MRHNEGYVTYIHQFAKDVLVICPSCSRQAIIHTNGFAYPQNRTVDIKAVCPHCGFNKVLERNPTVVVNGFPKKSTVGKHLIFGSAIDPFFHLPLWLTCEVQGNLLWAYNYEHLAFLKSFVESKLRERNGKALTNSSIASRLPRWMTSRNNRHVVLKSITDLSQK